MLKNQRLLLTFQNVHALLAAEKCLRIHLSDSIDIRATSTPPYLTESVCSMALEVFNLEKKDEILETLRTENKEPSGVHLINHD